MNKTEKILLFQAIQQSNLHPTTKSFLGQVLKAGVPMSAEEAKKWMKTSRQIPEEKRIQGEMKQDWMNRAEETGQGRVRGSNIEGFDEGYYDHLKMREADARKNTNARNFLDIIEPQRNQAALEEILPPVDYGEDWEGDATFATGDDEDDVALRS
jgi:hypothetical protein